MFSNISVYTIDKKSHQLKLYGKISGSGQRDVTIYCVEKLPQNIFHDVMYISSNGMASGDQSLGEFISLTGKMPFYDMQRWKRPLVDNITMLAEKKGGAELKEMMSFRSAGALDTDNKFKENTKFVSEKNQELMSSYLWLNNHISKRQANKAIESILQKFAEKSDLNQN